MTEYGKSRPTLYTPRDRSAARENVRSHEWAKAIEDRVTSSADAYLDSYEGLEELWNLVTSQRIPRSAGVSGAGSPITGTELINEHGSRGWAAVPESSVDDPREPKKEHEHVDLGGTMHQTGADVGAPTIRLTEYDEDFPWKPWKLLDPSSGYVFPTNDFAAYRESGRDERGFFDPELADESLLVNELYPAKPDDWGVDDGTGWTAPDGTTYTFVAYYNHWFVWYVLRSMARVFRDAYLLSDRQEYATAATVVLDRIADVYPELDVSVWGPDAPFGNSNGGTGQGKAVGSIWETGLINDFVSCYDAVFPGQDDDRIVDFLSERAERYDLGRKSTVADVRRNVEANVVREVLPAVRDAQIRGNFGYHQSSLAISAVVADDPEGYSSETLDFLFRPGEYVSEDDGSPWGKTAITGGNLLKRLVDEFDRDGHHDESPYYNQGRPEKIGQIAGMLADFDGYDAREGPDLDGNVTVEKIHAALLRLVTLGRFLPHIGDSAKTGDPELFLPRNLDRAFETYGDSIYAQGLYLQHGHSLEGFEPDVFSPDADEVLDRLERVVETEGPLDLPSENLAGYGFAALRDGRIDLEEPDRETRREAWVHYGRSHGSHNHADALNLGLFAHGLNLAPDLGYPERTGPWPKRVNWTENTVSHNTVVVDGRMQQPQWVGEPHHFDDAEHVKLVDVSAPRAYPRTDAYRRTTAMIRVDDRRSYLVDFFRVEGGDDHVFSFHGAEGSVDTETLDLRAQESGTYAGEDVSRPGYGENASYNEAYEHPSRDIHSCLINDGFNYLDEVERAADPPERFGVTWDVEDTWNLREDDDADVKLNLTVLGDLDEVALADGHPPDKPGNPDTLRYLLARRRGSDLQSAFTSVIEPYEGSPAVEAVESVPVTTEDGRDVDDGRAVKAVLEGGRTDYVASVPDREGAYAVDDAFTADGRFVVYSAVDGEPVHAYLTDGRSLTPVGEREPLIDRRRGRLEATVADFTRELAGDNVLAVRFETEPDDLDALAGEWIYVSTDRNRNGAYRIEDARRAADGRVTLDVGDATTVQEFEDPERPEAGYVYLVDEGDAATVPLSATWTRPGR